MFAAQGGHAAVAEVLLRKGADPRITDTVNDLPVMFVFLSMPLTQSLPCRKGRLLLTWLIMTPYGTSLTLTSQ